MTVPDAKDSHEDSEDDNDGYLEASTIRSSQNSLATLLRTLELSAQNRCQKVRVKGKGKGKADFSDLYLCQQLICFDETSQTKASVYCLRFSPDGNYLAAGCSDGLVRVWTLIVEEVLRQAEIDPTNEPPLTAAIFNTDPLFIFHGHEGEVVDLSWSPNSLLLLSASIDGTVRLWTPTRSDCLAVFPHSDIVTSVAFHPRDDRIFISGSFDCRIRLWSIEERRVMAWNELPAENQVTAVAWTSNGQYALAGSSTGVLLFFDFNGFKYYTQILVKSSRGKNAVGKKISSIQIKPGSSVDSSPPLGSVSEGGSRKKRPVEDQIILVSSNDSRLRAYQLRDKSEAGKYLGHLNDTSQIKASYSDDAEFIISGSEDGKCCIWATEQTKKVSLFSKDCRFERYDVFYAATSVPCTAAIFAPASVQGRLQSARLRPILGNGPGSNTQGRIIVTADLEGRIRVFENSAALPGWLDPPPTKPV